jgi:hypothetical protein
MSPMFPIHTVGDLFQYVKVIDKDGADMWLMG